ncbi:MAG: hypothetical protein LC687_07750 [Actinobacteria bacterium]|nr:hypothetical protein [Actinomycetota bacterium]
MTSDIPPPPDDWPDNLMWRFHHAAAMHRLEKTFGQRDLFTRQLYLVTDDKESTVTSIEKLGAYTEVDFERVVDSLVDSDFIDRDEAIRFKITVRDGYAPQRLGEYELLQWFLDRGPRGEMIKHFADSDIQKAFMMAKNRGIRVEISVEASGYYVKIPFQMWAVPSLAVVARTIAALCYRKDNPGVDVDHLLGGRE